MAAGQVLRTMLRPANPLELAFSPDGTVLASGWQDGLTVLWETRTGMELASLVGFPYGIPLEVAIFRPVPAFSPDGTLLAIGSWDGTVRLWGIHR